ncbi:MAG TPA: long-chain fatty acid--CoA ligase [Verrucomicrobiae bacterium]|nr:long-chain fatty acid--CoA ligase [Verrucomicrobiae bacterium]
MNLALAFAESAAAHKGKPAIFWGEEEITYDALLQRVQEVGGQLQVDSAVKKGDRVALWMKNCPDFAVGYFGILSAGGVVVPVNSFLKPEEIVHILADAGVNVLVTERSMADGVQQLSEARKGLKAVWVEEGGSQSGTRANSSLQMTGLTEEDLAVLIYTSGTTGRSKGAMLTHGNLLSNVHSCGQVLMAVEHDSFVVLLPMFHSFMMTVGMLLPLMVGGSLLLIKSVHPPKNMIGEIMQRRATILPAVPQFFRTLASAPLPKDWPLRLCISGGAPLPAEILREFNEKMPIPLIEGYGLSEASPVVTLNPIKGPWKAGSIGTPIPGVEVSVQDDDGNTLGVGETGEICVRGPNVMRGYWNQPSETAKALRNGWLLTGDIGHRDADGYFFITDRKKDMLLVNGINVYPREIEECIYQFPGIKEAAVIGVPDQRKGEQPLAFVAMNESVVLDEKAFLQFLRGKLADYKVPKRVICMPALPRNATGKILKRALREQAAKINGN